jgi:hypothetical protein
MVITRILKRLEQPGARALESLPVYSGPEYSRFWQRDPRIYRAFGRKLISGGHPTRAFELAREGLSHHPDDPELRYVTALALARGGEPPPGRGVARRPVEEPGA